MKTILVTGVNSGIGKALFMSLQKTDMRVIGTVRPESLRSFLNLGLQQSDRVLVRTLDICDYAQAEKLVEELNEKFGGVDILVNNAGISYRSVVEHMDIDHEEHQMRVNYLGPFHLIRLVLPKMREKKNGRIINVSSVSGMMAMPTMASYSASKFALEGASEALWYEVKPWNIHVTLIQPGFVNSKSFRNVLSTQAAVAATTTEQDPYHAHYVHMTTFVEKLMLNSFASPEKIAKKIIATIDSRHPPLRASGTPDAWFFYLLRRWIPRFIYHTILYLSLPHIRKWGPSKK